MSSVRLTTTSYVVLGMVESFQPVTPYVLKQMARLSVFHFWAIPHTQLYAECDRLAREGLLAETREEQGRRRREFRLTTDGRTELDAWRADPVTESLELRDPAIVKLFFGADAATLAPTQIERHRALLDEYRATAESFPEMPDGMRRALDTGIQFEERFIEIWERYL